MSGPDVATVAEMFAGLYDIVEPMPWNGLALTYKAKKDGLPVVLALLPIDCEGAPASAALFEVRAKALVGLEHPRLLSVKGQGIRYGVPFLELAYVEGETLDHVVAAGPLERERAMTIARRVLRALELLEAVSILHLDLTPPNILVVGEDDVRVMGSGVAALLREVRDDDKTGPTGKGSGKSPGRFLAPELLVGDKLDARSDIYSVGALLHFMLTGHLLGKGGPRPPRDLGIVIAKATEKARDARYPRASTMRLAIEAAGAPLSVNPPPPEPSPSSAPMSLPKPPRLPSAMGARDLLAPVPHAASHPPLPPIATASLPPLESPAPDFLAPAADAPGEARPVSRALIVTVAAVAIAAAIVATVVLVMPPRAPTSGEADLPAEPVVDVREPESEPEPEPGSGSGSESESESESEFESESGSESEPESELDLLSGDLPEPLDTLWPRVAAGEELPMRERHLAARYASAHPDDARPHLLVARDFMARGWSSDAIQEYSDAFTADPECRADVRMRDDLMELASRDGSGAAAARLIARIYGRDALPDVEAMLDGDLEPNPRRRLDQLLRRLSAL